MSHIVIVNSLKHTVLELLIHIRLHHSLLGQSFGILVGLVSGLGWLFQGLDKLILATLALNILSRLINIIEIIQVFRRLPLFLQQAVCFAGRAAIDRLRLNNAMGLRVVLEQIEQTVGTAHKIWVVRVDGRIFNLEKVHDHVCGGSEALVQNVLHHIADLRL